METSFAQLASRLDSFHSSKRARPLHIFSVFPQISVKVIPQAARAAGVGAGIKETGENVYNIEIVSAYKRRFAYGQLIDLKGIWIFLIRTVESPTVAGNVARLWLDRMYPAISRSYIKPEDLLNIMDDLAKIEDSKLELRGYVLRAHDSPETMKKWPRDKPYSREKIEQDISRENKLLEAINFIFRVQGTFFNVRIETNGHFVFYKGGPRCFSNFQRLVLSRYNDVALTNHRYFSNRERKIVDGKAEISQIILVQPKRFTKNDLESLTLHLGKNYSTGILHSGNPWLLMNILDRGDGSSFDVYGYPSEIKIVPFNKASPESLIRLFYTVRELFPLSDIKESAVM
jgi:hypothetical protein